MKRTVEKKRARKRGGDAEGKKYVRNDYINKAGDEEKRKTSV